MSVSEIEGRPGYFRVVVYDRIEAPGQRPVKIQRVVKGQKAAEKVERDLKAERDRGSLAARRQTLSAYAERYLKSRRAEVSAQTLEGYSDIVSMYVDRHAIGKMRVGDIDATAVADFYAAVLERGSVGTPVSPETVRGVHRVLSMILKRATVDGLLHVNPCTVVKVPKNHAAVEQEDREPGVDPEVASAFVAAVSDLPIGPVAAVALGTGLRRSELLGLRWQDIDFAAGELHAGGKIEQTKGRRVQRTAMKTKRSARTVPFGSAVAGVLKEQRRTLAAIRLATVDGMWREEGWVFPGRFVHRPKGGAPIPAGGVWSLDSFSHEWQRDRLLANEIRLGEFVLAGGKVEDFEPWEFGIHALRHAYATAQLAAGVRPETVSRRLGHSSSLITMRVYSHVLDSERRDGVDAADSLLSGGARGRNGTVR